MSSLDPMEPMLKAASKMARKHGPSAGPGAPGGVPRADRGRAVRCGRSTPNSIAKTEDPAMSDETDRAASRRDFVRLSAFGVAAGAATMAAAPDTAQAAQAEGPAASDATAGYRLSDHVRRYYELARL